MGWPRGVCGIFHTFIGSTLRIISTTRCWGRGMRRCGPRKCHTLLLTIPDIRNIKIKRQQKIYCYFLGLYVSASGWPSWGPGFDSWPRHQKGGIRGLLVRRIPFRGVACPNKIWFLVWFCFLTGQPEDWCLGRGSNRRSLGWMLWPLLRCSTVSSSVVWELPVCSGWVWTACSPLLA